MEREGWTHHKSVQIESVYIPSGRQQTSPDRLLALTNLARIELVATKSNRERERQILRPLHLRNNNTNRESLAFGDRQNERGKKQRAIQHKKGHIQRRANHDEKKQQRITVRPGWHWIGRLAHQQHSKIQQGGSQSVYSEQVEGATDRERERERERESERMRAFRVSK